MIDPASQKILCVAVASGKTHDFALFKSTRLAPPPQLEVLADSGYQGLEALHPNSCTPYKKSKLHPLTPQQKRHNRVLASCRIKVEHALGFLKRFRIRSSTYRNRSSTYRNRRKRFGLRLNLLAAIANLLL